MSEKISPAARIILALDVDEPVKARELVERTESHISFYKVGLQLFLAGGFQTVDWIVARGHRLMLDLKFFDIPATVRLAMEQLRGHGITFTTVHGNEPIVRAAVEAKGDIGLLAVTVLTSFGEGDMREMGMSGTIDDLVYSRARRAMELGCDGVVASGREAGRLRQGLGKNLRIVTPGIRPGAAAPAGGDDQKRVVSARQAVADGADYLVIGRPITRAPDPLQVIEDLQEEIRQALTGTG